MSLADDGAASTLASLSIIPLFGKSEDVASKRNPGEVDDASIFDVGSRLTSGPSPPPFICSQGPRGMAL